MIHILLLILKIIGIVLLAVIFLVLLLLFYPVTYKMKGVVRKNDYQIKISAGWLFQIIHFKLSADNEGWQFFLKAFGISIVKYPQKRKKKEDIQKTVIKKKSEGSFEQPVKEDGEEILDKILQIREGKVEEEKKTESKKQNNNIIIKIQKFLIYLFLKIKNLVLNIKAKKDKIIEIKKFISANTTKEAYHYAKKILFQVIKHISPAKIRGRIHYGFDMPDITGKTLGHIAIIFGMFHINPKHIRIAPDFNHKVFEGDISLKGHVMAGVIVFYLFQLYRKKEIRDIIKKIS